MRLHILTIAALATCLAAGTASAKEYPIGEARKANGLEISAVYLQPIEMDPPGLMRPAAESDIHLETDIRADQGNANGFPEGEWVPYLSLRYVLTRLGTGESVKGDMMPMVANDGPHYGDNVKLMGPGRYRLSLTILPPGQDGHPRFGRHVDKETGVSAWFAPFTVDYEFVFAGIGKKGGY